MQRFTEISARGAVARVVRRLASAFAGIVLLASAATTRADLIVPAGSIVTLNAGTADLACTDVKVAGTLQVGAGSLANVRHLTIARRWPRRWWRRRHRVGRQLEQHGIVRRRKRRGALSRPVRDRQFDGGGRHVVRLE